MFASKLIKYASDRRGNVAVTFGLSMLPLLFAIGVSLDYGAATKKRAKMNAAADAAALYAVTPAMMSQPFATAKLAAANFFNGQVAAIPGLKYDPTSLQIAGGDSQVNNSIVRTVTVSYSAASNNSFGGVLHMSNIPIAGTSTSSSTVALNIDFYLMLDTSPSMAIAATQDGIAKMVAATPTQGGGCAFACHETNPALDGLNNPGGPLQDNYALARALGVPLRIDLVSSAVQNLMTTAIASASSTGANYRTAAYTFDVSVKNPIPLTSNLSLAQNLASSIQVLQVYSNNVLSLGTSNSDEDTNFDLAFKTINQAMPNPGNGTGAAGDTPQEILFVVTDGVADESSSGTRTYTPFGSDPTWCTQIKNRGIRIAVLYTTYFPLPQNPWYNTYIKAEQPTISPMGQSCASPGLFQEVSVGGDISGALSQLFTSAVQSAHLTN